jgi:hypothetical protein
MKIPSRAGLFRSCEYAVQSNPGSLCVCWIVSLRSQGRPHPITTTPCRLPQISKSQNYQNVKIGHRKTRFLGAKLPGGRKKWRNLGVGKTRFVNNWELKIGN